MRFYTSISKAVVVGSLLVFSGCSDSSPSTDAPVTLANAVCPVMGGKANADVTVEWNDQTVGFCCAPCISVWEKLSDEEKKEKLAKAAVAVVPDGSGHK